LSGYLIIDMKRKIGTVVDDALGGQGLIVYKPQDLTTS
jgi:hypothetical protein